MKWNRPTVVLSAIFLAGLLFSANLKDKVLASPQAPAKSAPPANDPASVGSWSAPISLGIVPIHAALLRNNQVLFWEYSCNTLGCNPSTLVSLYNPATKTATTVPTNQSADYFCSGATQLPDGRLLIDGGLYGTPGTGDTGTTNATIYDPTTNTFTAEPNMAYARYYPTNVSLPDGTQLVVSGQDATGAIVKQLEKWDPTKNSWSTLPNAANLPHWTAAWNNYPRMFVLPLSYLGGTIPPGSLYIANQLFHTWFFNPTTNVWTFIGQYNTPNRFRGAQLLMPDFATVMVMGGQSPGALPTNTVETINLSSPTPAWTYAAPMNNPRHDLNAVQLPDGTVLVVGGAAGSGDYTSPVKAAELYTPSTNTWTTLASQQGSRGYHSTALLLTDGTVISEGSDSGDQYQKYLEVFSPPYLFKGPRPVISGTPAKMIYGQPFTVSTPNAASIASIALIKTDSLTHANHMDQRFQNLTFTQQAGGLRVTPPANANYAPPGFYMLFLVSTNGVPSIAKIMQVTTGTPANTKVEAVKSSKQ